MQKLRAFTLVEMLVVMAMVGVVMGALLTSFLIGRKSYLSADSYVQVQQEARRAFDVMVKELREARVDGPDADGPNGVTTEDFTDVPRVNLQVALGYDLNNNPLGCPVTGICWGEGTTYNDWVHYLVLGAGNQAQLLRCTSAGSDTAIATTAACTNMRVLANGIQTFQVSYVAGKTKTITIQLAVQQASGQLAGGSMTTTPAPLVTRVRLRN
jgi:prepilin-type N-terminal cleavage/methylation domain-containing protein